MQSAEEIKELRERLQLTQEQLAKELGVSWTTVSRWERGKCKPSPLATKMLSMLNVKATEEA